MNDYARIAKVIRYLDECHSHQPHLAAVAALLGQSPFHFHRLFKHWAGITPKAFVQCLTLEEAKRGLQAGRSESDSTLDDGLSGPGRLHDLCVKLEAASPDEIKSGGQGLELSYGIGPNVASVIWPFSNLPTDKMKSNPCRVLNPTRNLSVMTSPQPIS